MVGQFITATHRANSKRIGDLGEEPRVRWRRRRFLSRAAAAEISQGAAAVAASKAMSWSSGRSTATGFR